MGRGKLAGLPSRLLLVDTRSDRHLSPTIQRHGYVLVLNRHGSPLSRHRFLEESTMLSTTSPHRASTPLSVVPSSVLTLRRRMAGGALHYHRRTRRGGPSPSADQFA